MKVSSLMGIALDYAVAVCEGGTNFHFDTVATYWITINGKDWALNKSWAQSFTPSTDWSQGGPIIEREDINLIRTDSDDYEVLPWAAEKGMQRRDRWHEAGYMYYQFVSTLDYGPTPLIAAMRCYVTSKLGDNIEIPEGLL